MIEAARTRTGDTPLERFFAILEQNGETTLLADVALRFEAFARYGRLYDESQFEYVGEGMYTLKTAKLRLPCFPARHEPGAGGIRITHGYKSSRSKISRRELATAKSIRGDDQL